MTALCYCAGQTGTISDLYLHHGLDAGHRMQRRR